MKFEDWTAWGSGNNQNAGVPKLTYFNVWAKGPACALALEHSGMEWEGALPAEGWKSKTPWLELPVLDVPGYGSVGHELAILNFIGQYSPEMRGETPEDFLASQQLMQECEDIYQKLSKVRQGSEEDAKTFWTDTNRDTHNRNFGVFVFLTLLEKFYSKCGLGGGRFTQSGKTVGECKLFSTLHALKLIVDGILLGYPGLSVFYDRFAAQPATQSVLTTGGQMPEAFKQYFKGPF